VIGAFLARVSDAPAIIGFVVISAVVAWATWKVAKLVAWARSKLAR
jgi:hypothetical protein